MKKLALHWKIIIGMVLGIVYGLIANKLGWVDFTNAWIKPWGVIFVNLLKLIAVPLVFASLIKGVASLSDISKLSRISVDEQKAEKLAGDLNSIFKFIEKLNELKTENVEPLTSVAETTLKLRADEIKSKNIREQIIKNSPQDNEDYFVVPKVIE